MIFSVRLTTSKSYIFWFKLHSVGGATVNNAAYSANLAFKFHSLEGATIYNDAMLNQEIMRMK